MKKHNACLWIFISLACVGLPACGGLLNSDEAVQHTYWLQPYSMQQSPLPAQDSPGLVVRFNVVPGLDSDRLLTLAPDAELNHVAGARWPDALPEFAGSLIRRSLRTAGWFSRVSDESNSAPQDCELDLLALKFYTLLDSVGAASSVQISMSGQFECRGLSHAVDLDVNVRVSQNRTIGVVSAHQEAMNSLTRSLLKQLGSFMASTPSVEE